MKNKDRDLMRINQFIASSGFCSRKRADCFIKERKVKVNNQIVEKDFFVSDGDVVIIGTKIIKRKINNTYIILNKPPGIITTAAPHIKNNIIKYVNYHERIFPVGRLDNQSEGLILLTDNGILANEIINSEHKIEKEYIVTVNKAITNDFIDKLQNGVRIYNPRLKDFVITNKCRVTKLSNKSFSITLTQGLNKQIRRMCRCYQYTVTSLQRIRLKNLHLNDLEMGRWRFLTLEEVGDLKNDN